MISILFDKQLGIYIPSCYTNVMLYDVCYLLLVTMACSHCWENDHNSELCILGCEGRNVLEWQKNYKAPTIGEYGRWTT